MERKDFLKRLGIAGVSLPLLGLASKELAAMDEPSNMELVGSCTIINSETEGPYPAPGSIPISTLERSDVREGQEGIELSLAVTLVDASGTCDTLEGLRVDIWQCNKRGYYSGYPNQPGIDGTQNTTGETWLRGIQYTDASGIVNFTTIYPGWYAGRVTHIHVQVFDAAENLVKTTQFAFPDALNVTVNNFYNTSGTNPTTNGNDNIFSDGYEDQLLAITGDTTNGFEASIEVGVDGSTLGLEELYGETGGQFSQYTIYPNPLNERSVASFKLLQSSYIYLSVRSMDGKLVYEIPKQAYESGIHQLPFDLSKLSTGIYLANLQVENDNGVFQQTRKIIQQ